MCLVVFNRLAEDDFSYSSPMTLSSPPLQFSSFFFSTLIFPLLFLFLYSFLSFDDLSSMVVVLSLGEAIWSPRCYDYTMSIAPEVPHNHTHTNTRKHTTVPVFSHLFFLTFILYIILSTNTQPTIPVLVVHASVCVVCGVLVLYPCVFAGHCINSHQIRSHGRKG